MVAQSIAAPAASRPCSCGVAEQYVAQFGNLAKLNNTMIVPTDLASPAAVVATAMSVIQGAKRPPAP